MKKNIPSLDNNSGFVLVVALVIMVMLTLFGIFATSTSVFELRIAGNDRMAKLAFYQADGGLQTGIEMAEQNLSCADGFDDTTESSGIYGINIYDKKLAYAEEIEDVKGFSDLSEEVRGGDDATKLDAIPSDIARSLGIPGDPSDRDNDNNPHTNLVMYGKTSYTPGSALQMVAGYEGLGKSAAQGGSVIELDIHSQHIESEHVKSRLMLTWSHLIGKEGSCKY